MKIGILTQPLHNNYGGVLQNYALQRVLRELGHEVYTINVYKKKSLSPFLLILSILKRTFLKILGRVEVIRAWPTKRESEIIACNTKRFIQINIKTTDLFSKKLNEKLLKKYDFSAYIIGSDQVWRPKYSPQLSSFFLDFIENDTSVKKIAYAASFGVSNWEFSLEQTKQFGRMLKSFDGVSVRESSAVGLCKKYFNVEATNLLDPTMLLDKEIYQSLVDKQNTKESSGNLFTYILDKSTDKDQIVNRVARKYDLRAFSILPLKSFAESGRKKINDCIFPPVEKWIRGFIDAQFVVTDSFHGTVFSILFNKPFVSIANKNRGLTRFTSLLKLFHLEDRLIFSLNNFNPDNLKEIEWEKVNKILIIEREKSIQFLKNNLF